MHSTACISKSNGSPIAVLDSIHGACVIARCLLEAGIEAEPLEVYHNRPSVERFGLVVAPVHLAPDNPAMAGARHLGKPIITHHRAVGEILGEQEFRTFEVTGTTGKTTASLILARILSARSKKVVSHTTRGLEVWSGGSSRLIRHGLSITPANVILAHEAARSERAHALVSEVSLGGTGAADCGVLTSLRGDYLIAGKTLWASTAKLQMLSLSRAGSQLVAGTDAAISADLTFTGASSGSGDVQCTSERLIFRGDSVPLSLGYSFDHAAYLAGIAAAAAASFTAGFTLEEAARALEGFDGLGGRMRRISSDGFMVFDNSNSGLKAAGVEKSLDISAGPGRLGLVVGEESETVCEGMDIPALLKLLRARREEIDCLVLVGERLIRYADDLNATVASDHQSGFDRAKERLSRGDRIILCVKCFR